MVTTSLANIANLSVATANSIADNVAEPITAAAFYLPAWLLVGGVLLALIIALVILSSIRAALLAKPKSRDAEFARMICEQVWRHTDSVTAVLAQRMREQPGDISTLRILLRHMIEELAAATHFVSQMLAHPPASWPGYGLFGAFGNWGGQMRSIESQLRELQRSLPYPITADPATYRDQMIVHQALSELQFLGQSGPQLRGYAFAICNAAKKSLKKDEHKNDHGDGHDEHAHADCPCCNRAVDHAPFAGPDPFKLPPLPPAPPKPTAPAPKVIVCHCASPRPCFCAGGCSCGCACPAPAK
ncbi:MAG: hypothetical protein EOP62_18945 [Sphingomonadales bacterium]|nr:MAG: hypothetical protein EOP62_18945 [Sphingomonadales bacterium]